MRIKRARAQGPRAFEPGGLVTALCTRSPSAVTHLLGRQFHILGVERAVKGDRKDAGLGARALLHVG